MSSMFLHSWTKFEWQNKQANQIKKTKQMKMQSIILKKWEIYKTKHKIDPKKKGVCT